MIPRLIVVAILLTTAGCRDDSVEIAREAADRQAAQNAEMLRLNREVAQGTERLIEADAQSRHNLLAAYRELHGEHANLAAQLHELEEQRRQIDGRRRAGEGLQATLEAIGLLLVVCFSLLLARYILASEHPSSPEELALLLHEFDLPAPPALSAARDPPATEPPQLQEMP